MTTKICGYCKNACWCDSNWYHICLLESGHLEAAERKEIDILGKCMLGPNNFTPAGRLGHNFDK